MFGYMYRVCTFFPRICSDQVHINLPYKLTLTRPAFEGEAAGKGRSRGMIILFDTLIELKFITLSCCELILLFKLDPSPLLV